MDKKMWNTPQIKSLDVKNTEAGGTTPAEGGFGYS
jgi:hypothetical protein